MWQPGRGGRFRYLARATSPLEPTAPDAVQHRPLCAEAAARPGRPGHRVRGLGPAAVAHGGGEDAAVRHRHAHARVAGRAVPQRGARRRGLEPHAHRHRARRRPVGLRRVHRDGAAARPRPAPGAAGRLASAPGRGRPAGAPRGRRAGLCARARRRALRHQAGQHLPDAARQAQGAGLRHRARGPPCGAAGAGRRDRRLAALPGARAAATRQRSTRAPTSMRWARCCTNCSPRARPSTAIRWSRSARPSPATTRYRRTRCVRTCRRSCRRSRCARWRATRPIVMPARRSCRRRCASGWRSRPCRPMPTGRPPAIRPRPRHRHRRRAGCSAPGPRCRRSGSRPSWPGHVLTRGVGARQRGAPVPVARAPVVAAVVPRRPPTAPAPPSPRAAEPPARGTAPRAGPGTRHPRPPAARAGGRRRPPHRSPPHRCWPPGGVQHRHQPVGSGRGRWRAGRHHTTAVAARNFRPARTRSRCATRTSRPTRDACRSTPTGRSRSHRFGS